MDLTMFESIVPALSQDSFFGITFGAILIIALAIAIVKGLALWHSARKDQKGWFWVLIFVNTMGILDLLYLLIWRKK